MEIEITPQQAQALRDLFIQTDAEDFCEMLDDILQSALSSGSIPNDISNQFFFLRLIKNLLRALEPMGDTLK